MAFFRDFVRYRFLSVFRYAVRSFYIHCRMSLVGYFFISTVFVCLISPPVFRSALRYWFLSCCRYLCISLFLLVVLSLLNSFVLSLGSLFMLCLLVRSFVRYFCISFVRYFCM